jgi:GNAT superfamily N-acetyltransferase
VTFPLTKEFVSQIRFAMEDQRHRFVVDRASGEVFREDEPEPGAVRERRAAPGQPLEAGGDEPAALDGVEGGSARFVPIPTWGPAEGFHLMERFVLKLRNPIFAEMLREALSSGQGVFRRFKEILRKNLEIERLWFSFKDKEMRRVVEQWYESERELAGLERLATGGEPPLELVASDVSILRGEARHVEPSLKLDQKVLGELYAGLQAGVEPRLLAGVEPRLLAGVEPRLLAGVEPRLLAGVEPRLLAGLRAEPYGRAGLPPLLDTRSLFLAAELAGGEFAGFAWAVAEDPACLRLVQLAVRKHFRGIGLGTQLLRRLILEARDSGYARVLAPLAGPELALAPLFEGLGFSAVAVELGYDLGASE